MPKKSLKKPIASLSERSEGWKRTNECSLTRERVYKIVRQVPKGRVMSYKMVAKLAGFPRAWRAVGNALNRNRNPKIPCHRVIRSDKEVGGYAFGIKRKTSLLIKEGVVIKNGRVVT